MNTLLKYLVRNLGHLFLRNIFSNSYFSRKNDIPYGSKKAFIDLQPLIMFEGGDTKRQGLFLRISYFQEKWYFLLFLWKVWYLVYFIDYFTTTLLKCFLLKETVLVWKCHDHPTLFNQFWGGLGCRYAMSSC